MTQAQCDLIIRLAGGLDGAMAAAEAAGFEMVKNVGKSAKVKDLLSISTKDASAIIDTLRGQKPVTPTRESGMGCLESQEVDGYMIDRGEDN